MADKTFLLDIVSPSRKVYSGPAISLSAPGVCGGFQVLHNHTEFLTPITVGEIKLIINPETTYHYATSGGIVEVHENKVIVLTESIERADEIDHKRAEESASRAEKRIQEHSSEVDTTRTIISLSRAKNRLKVSEKHKQ